MQQRRVWVRKVGEQTVQLTAPPAPQEDALMAVRRAARVLEETFAQTRQRRALAASTVRLASNLSLPHPGEQFSVLQASGLKPSFSS